MLLLCEHGPVDRNFVYPCIRLPVRCVLYDKTKEPCADILLFEKSITALVCYIGDISVVMCELSGVVITMRLIDMSQHMKRQEAEQQRMMDEELLRKQMNAKKAKEQAEKLHKVGAVAHILLEVDM